MPKIVKKTVQKLKKELDTIFSRYIRLKYADANGYVQCFTCGRMYFWKEIQNGHYVRREYNATRYHEKNCHPQCVGCNMFKAGNMDEYTLNLVKKYGDGILEELNALKHTIKQFTCEELEEMKKKYKGLTKQWESLQEKQEQQIPF